MFFTLHNLVLTISWETCTWRSVIGKRYYMIINDSCKYNIFLSTKGASNLTMVISLLRICGVEEESSSIVELSLKIAKAYANLKW